MQKNLKKISPFLAYILLFTFMLTLFPGELLKGAFAAPTGDITSIDSVYPAESNNLVSVGGKMNIKFSDPTILQDMKNDGISIKITGTKPGSKVGTKYASFIDDSADPNSINAIYSEIGIDGDEPIKVEVTINYADNTKGIFTKSINILKKDPKITSIAKDTAETSYTEGAAGNEAYIFGEYFIQDRSKIQVFFGTAEAQVLGVEKAGGGKEYIRCIVPGKKDTLDTVNLKVINKYSSAIQHHSNNDKNFTYIIVPEILYIDGSNYVKSNDSVTIMGNNFPVNPDLEILLQNVLVPSGNITDSTPNKITFTIPASAPKGPLNFTIRNKNNHNIAVTIKNFLIKDATDFTPKINKATDTPPGIAPAVGNPGGGDILTITGGNYITVYKDGEAKIPKVYFIWDTGTGGKKYIEAPQVKLKEDEGDKLIVTTPPSFDNRLGEAKVIVINPDLNGDFASPDSLSSTISEERTFTYRSTIVISSVNPDMGSVQGGYDVTLTGINFDNLKTAQDVRIYFGPYRSNFDKSTAKIGDEGRTVRVTVPTGWVPQSGKAVVDVRIELETADFTEIAYLADAFTYVAPQSNPTLAAAFNDQTKMPNGPLEGNIPITVYVTDLNYYPGDPLNGIYFEDLSSEKKMIIEKTSSVKLSQDLILGDGSRIPALDTNNDPIEYYKIEGKLPPLETEGLKNVYLVNRDGARASLSNYFNYRKARMQINGVNPTNVDLGGELQILGYNFKEDTMVPQVILEDLDDKDNVKRVEAIPSTFVTYGSSNIDGVLQEYLYLNVSPEYVLEGKKRLILKNSFGQVAYKYVHVNPRGFQPVVDYVLAKEKIKDSSGKEQIKYSLTDLNDSDPKNYIYAQGSVLGGSELILLGNNVTSDTKLFVDDNPSTGIAANMYSLLNLENGILDGGNELGLTDLTKPVPLTVSIQLPGAEKPVKVEAVAFKKQLEDHSWERKILIFRNNPLSDGSTMSIDNLTGANLDAAYLKDNLRTYRYLTGKVPACTTFPGNKTIRVQNPGEKNVTLTIGDGFKYYSNPVLEKLEPNKTTTNGGNYITVIGQQFYQGLKVGLFDKDGNYLTSIATEFPDGIETKHINNNSFRFKVPAGLPITSDSEKIIIKVKNREEEWQGSINTLEVLDPDQIPENQKPEITGVNPLRGPVSGGTIITVTGENFFADTALYFGYEKGKIESINAGGTEMKVTIPPNEKGFYDLTVVNESNGYAHKYGEQFEYLEPGSLPSFHQKTPLFPNEGPRQGGTKVVIKGENFQKGLTVYIGAVEYKDNEIYTIDGQDVKVLRVIDSSTMELVTKGAPKVGPYDVTIINPDTGTATLKNGFTYKMPDSNPRITSVTPAKGSRDGGTLVRIEGQDFRKEVKVFFDNLPATIQGFDEASGVIWVIAPAHPVGMADITVLNRDGGLAQAIQAFEYLIPESNPIITKVEPNKGSTAGGTKVILTGNDFRGTGNEDDQEGDPKTSDIKVYFGPNLAPTVNKISYDKLEVITPIGIGGKTDITIINDKEEHFGSFTLRGGFEYVTSKPKITSVEPNFGTYEGGTIVTIYGEDINSAEAVFIGEQEATIANDILPIDGAIIIRTPESKTADGKPLIGKRDIIVRNPDGEQVVLKNGFEYLYPDSKPEITSVRDDAGPTVGGMPITIEGKDFREGVKVIIGGKAATNLELIGETTLKCRVPAHTAGRKNLILINADGGSAVWTNGFTYLEPLSKPVITSVEPNRGTTDGSTLVTIKGNDFRDKDAAGVTGKKPKVFFGNNEAKEVKYIRYNEITAITPEGMGGAVDITVVNPDYGQAVQKNGFNYVTVKSPILKTITPDVGPEQGGTKITLTGDGIAQGAKVMIGGKEAEELVFVDANTLEALTPGGEAGKQEVYILNPDGGRSNILYFTYRGKPETPGALRAEAKDHETIELRWDKVDFTNNYEIYMSESSSDKNFRFLEQVSFEEDKFNPNRQFTYYVTKLEPDTRYYFQVRAVNEVGFSRLTSDTVSAKTKKAPRGYDDENSPEEVNELTFTEGKDQVTVVANNERSLRRSGYLIDLAPYSKATTQKISFHYGALLDATGNILVRTKSLHLDITPRSLLPVAYGYRSSSGTDLFAHLEIKDLGGREAEKAIKDLPKGAKIVGSVFELGLSQQNGKTVTTQTAFSTSFRIGLNGANYTLGANKGLYLYTFNPAKNKWESLGRVSSASSTYPISKTGKYLFVSY